MFRLESNRLAAKRAYYRRLDKVAAMQQENKSLQDVCEDQKNRINVYETLVRTTAAAANGKHRRQRQPQSACLRACLRYCLRYCYASCAPRHFPFALMVMCSGVIAASLGSRSCGSLQRSAGATEGQESDRWRSGSGWCARVEAAKADEADEKAGHVDRTDVKIEHCGTRHPAW